MGTVKVLLGVDGRMLMVVEESAYVPDCLEFTIVDNNGEYPKVSVTLNETEQHALLEWLRDELGVG